MGIVTKNIGLGNKLRYLMFNNPLICIIESILCSFLDSLWYKIDFKKLFIYISKLIQ